MRQHTTTTSGPLATLATPGEATDTARDIETARRFYADLLALAARMETAGEAMRNRGRWLEATVALHRAEALLEQFIGERLTADLRHTANER